ncbi:glycosyltransferase [Candidatus Woesearchaeota archaeon]|nr:glycosyltransferase [Candidatus Woesearchaeota archaeon]
MRLSIIIPNYNGSETILKTIESIYSSNNINRYEYEILMIDNDSTDDSVMKVNRKFPTVKTFVLDRNRGASAARNTGIGKSKGDILIFIDGDAWFNRSTISSLMHHLKKDTDIVFPKISFENGYVFYPVFDFEKRFIHISGCFMAKKTSLEKVAGLFDEFYETYLEDYDFFMRCRLSGLESKYAPDARVIHADKRTDGYYEKRYYLEFRNTLYGMLKLGRYAGRSKLYNPFTITALFKAAAFGMLNFAWFNWYGYDRKDKRLSLLFSKKRPRIFRSIPLFTAPFVCIKAISNILANFPLVLKSRKETNRAFSGKRS